MRVFISHSSKDAKQAEEVCQKLESAGHSCFMAPRDIRSGYEYAEEIINGIDSSDIVLLLMSEASNTSPHVLREIERAVSKKKGVFVYKLEEVVLSKSMEYFLMTHQWLNFKGENNYDEIVERVDEYARSHTTQTAALSEQPISAAPSPAATSDEKKANGSDRRNIIIIAAAVILAAAGIIAAICLSGRSGENSAAPTESTPAPAEERLTDESDKKSADEDWFTTEEPSHTLDAQTVDYSDTNEQASLQSSEVHSPTESADRQNEPDTQEGQPEVEVIVPATSITSQQQTATTQEPSHTEPEITAAKAEPGDSLMFGTYNGEPIKWRVLRISEDGTQAVVIANDILTMKAYDAAEGGEYNKYNGESYWTSDISVISPEIQRQIRGDNRWEYSNIRTWLNSSRENVVYSGQAPTSKAMSEKRGGYHTEAGFLNAFTKQELSALVETQITTNGSVTSDKVFLISSDELDWLYEADVSIYAVPTASAVEQDDSNWYKVDLEAYGVDDFFWWLRDANPDNSCECYYVNISYTEHRLAKGSVGLEGYGIRPALTLDLTSDIVKQALEN